MDDIKRYDKITDMYFRKDEYIQTYLETLPNEDLLAEQWEKLPAFYDSEVDTLKHIKRVNELLLDACKELMERAKKHDSSKLDFPEKKGFDEAKHKLKTLSYGSEEYMDSLGDLREALKHHYNKNSHHPEYYENGVFGMDLFDVIEMFLDWTAACERVKNGSIFHSIEINKKRFNLSDQLVSILTNTATKLQNCKKI